MNVGVVLRRGAMAALVVVYGFPLYFLVATSLRPNDAITNDAAAIIFEPTLESYQVVLDSAFVSATSNSLQIALGGTLLLLLIGVPFAYGCARIRGRVLALVIGALIAFQMVPATASVIPLFRVLGSVGMLGSVPGLIVADTALLLPFVVLLLRPFFRAVPIEVEEASMVEGANQFQVFRHVALPLASNGVTTVAVMTFVILWGEFLYAVSFLNPSAYPTAALLASQISWYGANWNRLMALAVLTALPVIIVFIFAQRRFREGLAVGAGK